MRKTFAVILFIHIGLSGICSTSPVKLDTATIYRKARSLVKDPRIIRSSWLFFNNIQHINDSTFYYNPEGTLHLFKVKIDTATHVEKISKSIYHGHNFSRKLYLHNSILYSLGGSGLFGETAHLLCFNEPLSEWLIAPIQDMPINVGSVINSWLNADTLSVIYLSKLKDSLVYAKINLKTKRFQRIGTIRNSENESYSFGGGYEIYRNEKYAILELPLGERYQNKCRYEILSLQNVELNRALELENLPCINGNSVIYIKEDTLVYRSTTGEQKKYFIDDLNVISKINYSKIYQLNFQNKSDYKAGLSALLLIICALIFISFVIFKKRRHFSHLPKEERIDDTEKEMSTIEARLNNLKGQTISRDELDDIFAITHQSADTMKSSRSLKIRKINERANNITITRIRNEKDRRYFEYIINTTSNTTSST